MHSARRCPLERKHHGEHMNLGAWRGMVLDNSLILNIGLQDYRRSISEPNSVSERLD